MKKGVSPIIATVLLVSLTVVLAAMVIIWFKSFTQEAITKFDNQNIELVCKNSVGFDASYSEGVLSLSNTGNSPIFQIKIKAETGGEYETDKVDIPNGLNPGSSKTIEVGDYSGKDKITIIPVLLGNTESGVKAYACSEDDAGQVITI